MNRGIYYLVVAIPLAAVLMGAVTLYLAFSQPDPGIRVEAPPMSKTSWQTQR